MTRIDMGAALLNDYLITDQALRAAILLEWQEIAAVEGDLIQQIELRMRNCQDLADRLDLNKIVATVTSLPLPPPSVLGTGCGTSEGARASATGAFGHFPATVKRILDGLRWIAVARQKSAASRKRWRSIAAGAIVLGIAIAVGRAIGDWVLAAVAAVVVTVVVAVRLINAYRKDRSMQAQQAEIAFQIGLAALQSGDSAKFERLIADAVSLVPRHRVSAVAIPRSIQERAERQFQAVVDALRRHDLFTFEKEKTALQAMAPEYRKAELYAMTRSGQFGTRIRIEAPIKIELCLVPRGPFVMGSDKQRDHDAIEDEMPQQVVTQPDYWIGRTEVTNEQFAVFARATGLDFNYPVEKGDHPAVRITFPTTQAFATWLGAETGLAVRLPTEEEWEKASRSDDGRLFPWGDRFDKTRLNSHEGEVGTTTPVDAYSPRGDSPYGASDMVGNVWEWTCSSYTKAITASVHTDDRHRVLRGGGFDNYRAASRCAYRRKLPIDVGGDEHVGFRVVVVPFQEPVIFQSYYGGLWE